MTFIVTVPKPEDHPQMLILWEASVRATHHFVTEEKIALFRNMIREQELFKRSDLLCVRDGTGQVIGFAGVSGESLDMLFVDPAMIGMGVGKALIQYAINTTGVTRVDVNEQNAHAKAFYEHFGFEVAGRSETDDNGEPFPLLHMERRQITAIITVSPI